MANETKYGVISDIHKDPRIVPVAIDILKSQGIEKLLVNGDIGENRSTLHESQRYIASILRAIANSGIESYVQPGSHETFGAFAPVMNHFSDKHSNLVDVIKNPKVIDKNHTLLFLPGSDWNAGGEYNIGNHEDLPTGDYIKTEKGLILFENFEQYAGLIQQGIAKGILHYQNINDLKGKVSDPDKTIVVCHVPRKFDNIDNCVDVAHFWQGRVYHRNPKNMQTWTYTKLSVVPISIPRGVIEKQNSTISFSKDVPEEEILNKTLKLIEKENVERWQVFVEQKSNRGNEELKNLYEELGITKAVSGHFHESGHRANDRQSKHVKEGVMASELFWNSGHLDVGQTGILTVGDGKVSYRNINLQNYIK